METMQGFQMIMNFLIMPMFFLSGALFPLKGVPAWMEALMRMDPLTYGVDAIRNIFFAGSPARDFMIQFSFIHDITVIGIMGFIFILLATWAFNTAK
ncbi:MAG: type transport system permease protein [Clostridia bacterium]|jgi:ABC-2 type transport system permease protein|nr:type transport system permease protein [Clostridia bacterium]